MDTRALVICVGNEILMGHIENTNAGYISRKLLSLGIKTHEHLSVRDAHKEIIFNLRNALKRSDIVVLSGGLGPTVDDITVECIAEALDRKLVFNRAVAMRIERRFKRKNIRMPRDNIRQAYLPSGARPILNHIGTAPGLIIEKDAKTLIALPGVPFELYAMVEKTVLPYLIKKIKDKRIIKTRIIKTTGLPESAVNEKIKDILSLKGNIEMGIYPRPQEISVKITVNERSNSRAVQLIKRTEKRIKARLGRCIFGYDEDTLEKTVGALLKKKKKTLALAESCTGGLLANRVTNVPGSSDYFITAFVTYSNEAKNKFLNIPLRIFKKYGAVSDKVARLMAKNARNLSGSDYATGISGIAGPGGGSKKKPVGLVYIAFSSKHKNICRKFLFSGQREIIKQKAAQAALNLIRLNI